jgi:hypothetical protein
VAVSAISGRWCPLLKQSRGVSQSCPWGCGRKSPAASQRPHKISFGVGMPSRDFTSEDLFSSLIHSSSTITSSVRITPRRCSRSPSHNHYKRLKHQRQGQRRRAGEVEHSTDRADRFRQDAARPDAGAQPRCSLYDSRCDDADRSRLRRRGRGEHHPQAAAVRRLQRRARPRAASSISTRSTRYRASPTIPRSPATYRARACSRRCSRSWKAPSPACRRRAAASIRSRNSCRSIRLRAAWLPAPRPPRKCRRAPGR